MSIEDVGESVMLNVRMIYGLIKQQGYNTRMRSCEGLGKKIGIVAIVSMGMVRLEEY